MTPLLTCAKYGFQKSFKILYNNERVNKLATNYNGQNCVHLAVKFHNNHIVKVRLIIKKMRRYNFYIKKNVSKYTCI